MNLGSVHITITKPNFKTMSIIMITRFTKSKSSNITIHHYEQYFPITLTSPMLFSYCLLLTTNVANWHNGDRHCQSFLLCHQSPSCHCFKCYNGYALSLCGLTYWSFQFFHMSYDTTIKAKGEKVQCYEIIYDGIKHGMVTMSVWDRMREVKNVSTTLLAEIILVWGKRRVAGFHWED